MRTQNFFVFCFSIVICICACLKLVFFGLEFYGHNGEGYSQFIVYILQLMLEATIDTA